MYETLDESEREIYTKKEEEDRARYEKEMVMHHASKDNGVAVDASSSGVNAAT